MLTLTVAFDTEVEVEVLLRRVGAAKDRRRAALLVGRGVVLLHRS